MTAPMVRLSCAPDGDAKLAGTNLPLVASNAVENRGAVFGRPSTVSYRHSEVIFE